jgi:hypothetical protein
MAGKPQPSPPAGEDSPLARGLGFSVEERAQLSNENSPQSLVPSPYSIL